MAEREARAVRLLDLALLVIAVANISSASVLVRLAGVHGFVAASWRLILSALITLVYVAWRERGIRLTSGELVLALLAGAALALHFGLWMMSLRHLTVAASVTIVDSYPALLAIAGRLLLGERYTRLQIAGATAAIAGVAGLAMHASMGGLSPPGGNPLLGSILSFIGMICVAVYFLAGKILRARLPTGIYTGMVYSIAGAISAAITIAIGEHLTGYSPRTYVYLVGLALLPMLGGHTVINYVLPRVSLVAATVPVLGEPVGASVLAAIILGEPITPGEAAWMAVVIAGIGFVLWGESRKSGQQL